MSEHAMFIVGLAAFAGACVFSFAGALRECMFFFALSSNVIVIALFVMLSRERG